jgi:hypothetical protein
MRIHRQNDLPELPSGRADHTTDTPARHLRWRARHRRDRGKARGSNAGQAPASDPGADQTARMQAAQVHAVQTARVQGAPGEPLAAPGETLAAHGGTMAAAMQLAIALLTAGLDSPELEAWAADELIPADIDGLADFMAGLHVISVVLLHELHEATGEPPAAILQRLAMLAEPRRGTPSAD